MSEESKTFEVTCAHCDKPFHVRFPLTRPGATGEGDVSVTCMYCNQNVMITIPQIYIKESTTVRSAFPEGEAGHTIEGMRDARS